ncbi:MAG TPA: alcohol dehydrogenase, partial [Firmicutes bacterium]|nr:alcohol dehydrogenase [Bacillota bacterium]
DPDGPSVIVVTENSLPRLEQLEIRFGPPADQRGATLAAYSPSRQDPEGLAEKIRDATGGAVFDDIVIMAPSAALVEESAGWLGDDGLLNIFAGVPRGTMAHLDLSKVYMAGQRWIGSSGSSLADLGYTLEKIQTRALRTESTVAAIAGLNAAKEGLQAVQDGSFPGKIVVWPQLPSLPLIPLPELAKHLPKVAAKLSPEGYWTKEAEDELLFSQLAKDSKGWG